MALDGLVEIDVKLVISADGAFAVRAAARLAIVLIVLELVCDGFDEEWGHTLLMPPEDQWGTDRRMHLAHCEFRFFPPGSPDELSPETDNSHWSESDAG